MTEHCAAPRALDGRRERGAIAIQVAIWLVVLVSFCAFVVDYGVLWVSRAQAQTAADAGALAGAVARAFDDLAETPSGSGAAAQSAAKTATANLVYGQAPGIGVSWDCPGFVASPGSCVQVDAYRDGTHGSARLDVYFATLFGVTSLGVRASATAQATVANATTCLKPWAVPDRWEERHPPSGQFNAFNKKNHPLSNPDVYVPPSVGDPGTGYRLPDDLGARILLKQGNPADAIEPGWFQAVQLPGSGNSGAAYRDNIASCGGVTVAIGDSLPVIPGNKVGPTKQGVDALIALDPSARWNASAKTVGGSCAPGCGPLSPRIVAVALYNPATFQGGDGDRIDIVNFLGVFVDGMQGNDVVGYLVKFAGKRVTAGGGVGLPSGFGAALSLVR